MGRCGEEGTQIVHADVGGMVCGGDCGDCDVGCGGNGEAVRSRRAKMCGSLAATVLRLCTLYFVTPKCIPPKTSSFSHTAMLFISVI